MILFATGFEDRIPLGELGEVRSGYPPEIVGVPLTGGFSIRGQTHRSGNDNRGFYAHIDSNEPDIWAGCGCRIDSYNQNYRIMGVFVDGQAVLEVGVHTSITAGAAWLAQPTNSQLFSYINTNKLSQSRGGWSFGLGVWRYVTLRIERRVEDGTATLWVDGDQKASTTLASLALGQGALSTVSFNYRGSNTTNAAVYAYFDDLWIATENLSGARIPALVPESQGHYADGEPSTPVADLAELVSDIPPSNATFIELAPEESVSFSMGTAPLDTLTPQEVGGIVLSPRLSGPTSWVVFVRIDGATPVTYDLEQIDVVADVPRSYQVTVSINPATGNRWTADELAMAEFGVRNGMMD